MNSNNSIAVKIAVAFLATAILMCAGHGTNSVGDKLTTGSYRQV